MNDEIKPSIVTKLYSYIKNILNKRFAYIFVIRETSLRESDYPGNVCKPSAVAKFTSNSYTRLFHETLGMSKWKYNRQQSTISIFSVLNSFIIIVY